MKVVKIANYFLIKNVSLYEVLNIIEGLAEALSIII